ncbi:MAG TPA: cyclic nucleotide-binding domain-containing protein [Gaiellaceae bacterium]|jgi:MFS family permease
MRSARLLAGVFRNPDLRRMELAFAGFNAAEWGVWIALLVYAYERGGATTAGVVAVVQLIPAAIFAPVAASFVDRRSPTRMLAVGYLAQSFAMAATATVLLAGGPAFVAYGLAAVAATAVTVTRPAQAVLLPSLARTPAELTAANVVSGWIESVSILVSPALAGLLLGAGGAGTVFAVMAVIVLVSAAVVAPLRSPAAHEDAPAGAALDGLRVVAHEPGPRSLVWLLTVEAVALGGLDVLCVVLAIGVLHHSGGTAAYLNAAFGAGGVAGVAVTSALVGRRRLAPSLLVALGLWAAALALIAAVPSTSTAFVLLAVAGVGRTLLDVSGRTLLQRTARPEALARVFGLLEGVTMAGYAVGSISASGFVALAGNRGAFACFAVLLPACALIALRGVLAADAVALPVVELARLRALPIFAPLDAATLEGLARCLEPLHVAAGAPVVREGERGDLFYIVADGELDITVGGEPVRSLGRGDCFGEIALLRDVPRTATVTARTAVLLDALEGTSFIAAVTGHDPSARAAAELVSGRLERATQGG